jgi:hypothetical protein
MSDKSLSTANKMFKVPSEDEITPVETLSGKNPKLENFRDHPEWDGHTIIVLHAELKPGTIADPVTGEIKDYFIMAALIYPEGVTPDPEKHGHLLGTGSGNIMARVSDAVTEKAFPIRGTLRKSGRAWFID